MKIITMPYEEVTNRFNILENDIDRIRKLIEGLSSNEEDTYLTKKQMQTSPIDKWR